MDPTTIRSLLTALSLFTVSGLSSSEQQAMSRIIEQKQMKDFLKLYTGLVERCFESCCNDFTSKSLSTKEVSITWRLEAAL